MNDIYINVGQTDELEWVRPSDWLPMPEIVEGQQIFVGLYPVFGEEDYCAMQCEGDYHVNWGDGVEEDVASGIKAQHVFDYDALAGTETSGGFRQALVIITPQAGKFLTKILFNGIKPNEFINTSWTSKWLEIEVVGSSIGQLTLPQSTYWLKSFKYIGINDLIYDKLFVNNYGLEKVIINTTNKNSLFGMFSNCYSLKITPELDYSNAINLSYLFYNCNKLKRTKVINAPMATIMEFMYAGCQSLENIEEIIAPNCTNVKNLFDSCYLLKKYSLIKAENANMANLFYICNSINRINNIETDQANDLSYMFGYCNELIAIENLNIIDGTNTDYMFNNCPSLSIVENCSFAESISFKNCLLSAQMLENIFNQLEVATGKVITITGNWGVPYLTQAQKDIAINKGWTIVE